MFRQKYVVGHIIISLSFTEVQDVQIVQAVQAVSEGIGDLGLFVGFGSVYFDPFMPLRFR
jgi:hypothetical protein